MIKKIKILLVLLLCIFSFFTIIIFDASKKDIFPVLYKKQFISDVGQFCLNNNKILMYTAKSGTRKWAYDTDIYINKQGFRDIDFEEKKGDIKILCIGNSITFGETINTESLFTTELSNKLGAKYSVYNLGVNGYNIIQEAENLRVNGIKYNPNIVIVVISLIEPHSSFYKHIYYAAKANNSKINSFLCKSEFYFKYIFIPIIKILDNNNDCNVEKIYRKYGTINVSNIADEEIGFKIFSDLQKEYNFKCYFFILPLFRNFNNYLKEDDGKNIFVKKILNKYSNLKYFDLKDYFINISKNQNIFIDDKSDFMHPNKYGHKLIADFIYNKLKENGVLE